MKTPKIQKSNTATWTNSKWYGDHEQQIDKY